MTAIRVSNIDDAILTALKTTLENATIDGRKVFERVAVVGSRDEAEAKCFTASPTAALVYEATETHDVPDQTVGCVLHAMVMVAAKGATSTQQSRELTRLINAARNVLHDAPPADANGFAEGPGGEYHPRIRVARPQPDENPTDPWAIAWLPVEVAYRTATNSSH